MTTQKHEWISLQLDDDKVYKASNTDMALLSPDNRGLAYADGFFTTIGVINGKILWQDYHQQRLSSHAHALQLDIPSQAVIMRLQFHAQQLQQGMMKLIVTRATQVIRGYGFSPDSLGCACEMWLKVTAMSLETTEYACLPNTHRIFLQQPTPTICLTSQLSCLPPTLAGLKSLNRLDSVLASGELQRMKVTKPDMIEALVRDMTGDWVEGTMSNVFYQLVNTSPRLVNTNTPNKITENYLLSGQWYTPPMTQSGVAGIMRQVIIDAFANTGMPIIMRSLTDDDLPKLSRLFFCNAVRGIMPVNKLTMLSGDKTYHSL